MKISSPTATSSSEHSLTWVESMGGPLIAVPVSVLDGWHGCTESGLVLGDGVVPDDYDRACEVDGLAGVIAIGGDGPRGLVLADEPATTCYLPEHRVFVRWLGANADADLIAAARAALADSTTEWEECGVWETDELRRCSWTLSPTGTSWTLSTPTAADCRSRRPSRYRPADGQSAPSTLRQTRKPRWAWFNFCRGHRADALYPSLGT